MVDKRTSLDKVNTMRQVAYIKRIVNQVVRHHLFDLADDATEESIRNMLGKGLTTIAGCRLLPTREQRRGEMSDSEKIIDILEEEISFDGKYNITLDVELRPVKMTESIRINFKVK